MKFLNKIVTETIEGDQPETLSKIITDTIIIDYTNGEFIEKIYGYSTNENKIGTLKIITNKREEDMGFM